MDGIDRLEKIFDDIYNTDEVIETALHWIEEWKNDRSYAMYDDCSAEQIEEIRNASVNYIGKSIFINREGSFPKFILTFRLNGAKNEYLYEIEYNLDGEVSDDYFEIIDMGHSILILVYPYILYQIFHKSFPSSLVFL